MCSRQVKLLKGSLERRDTPFDTFSRNSGVFIMARIFTPHSPAQRSFIFLEFSARSASYASEFGSYNLRMVEVISQHKRTPRRTFQTHQTAP